MIIFVVHFVKGNTRIRLEPTLYILGSSRCRGPLKQESEQKGRMEEEKLTATIAGEDSQNWY